MIRLKTPMGGDITKALRRYVGARAAGRTHYEYTRFLPELGAWVGCREADTGGVIDGINFRRIRQLGAPWCIWSGRHTAISEDHQLAAFFELQTEPGIWRRLEKEVNRNSSKAYADWRRRGRALLYATNPGGVGWRPSNLGELAETTSVRNTVKKAMPDIFRKAGQGIRTIPLSPRQMKRQQKKAQKREKTENQ